MKILIIANTNSGHFSPFVMEQVNELRKQGCEIELYGIVGKGCLGYLNNIRRIKKTIKLYDPDIIHAHYGLCGLLANFQRKKPVVTTYHGSDIHSGGLPLLLSRLSISLSAYNIFVSKKLEELSKCCDSNCCVLPCGIDLMTIKKIEKSEAKIAIGINKPFVLFSSSFTNDIKNPSLAMDAMKLVSDTDLIELKGYSRQDVNILMNAADCLLMTSHREGSPQVIKEAMACGTPIVSVDVGDVPEVIEGTKGCFIAERNPQDIAKKIKMALAFKGKTNGRQRITDLGLSNDIIARNIIKIYHIIAHQ